MGEPGLLRMTVEDFLAWDEAQPDGRHELVDGVPQAMTGAKERHDAIVMNLHHVLVGRLRGRPCRAYSADSAVRIPNGNVRRPDASIDCGPRHPGDTSLHSPVVIFEVLSRSTRVIDHYAKMEDYRSVPTVAVYVLVYQEVARVTVFRRSSVAWTVQDVVGPQSRLDLPEVGIGLTLAELYEEIDLAE